MDNGSKIILGIETSCDDTAAAVVQGGRSILSNIVSSQNEIHKKYGGVVPEIASRRHIEVIDVVIKEALAEAGVTIEDINAVSVTNRPGLIGSLLVGVGAAKAISFAAGIPLIAINHLKAHLYSNILASSGIRGNFIGLIVSGGHTSLYRVNEDWAISEIGHTVDDAAGEAFDKIARFLNLGYPGGPIIDKLSKKGDPDFIDFPRPMIDSGNYNFSFSGLKTSLIYKVKKNRDLLNKSNLYNLVSSFQKAIVDVLVEKAVNACKEYGCRRLLVSGGVAANSRLREDFKKRCKRENINLHIPPLWLCMDNASMVAGLGYYELAAENISSLDVDVYSKSDF